MNCFIHKYIHLNLSDCRKHKKLQRYFLVERGKRNQLLQLSALSVVHFIYQQIFLLLQFQKCQYTEIYFVFFFFKIFRFFDFLFIVCHMRPFIILFLYLSLQLQPRPTVRPQLDGFSFPPRFDLAPENDFFA